MYHKDYVICANDTFLHVSLLGGRPILGHIMLYI